MQKDPAALFIHSHPMCPHSLPPPLQDAALLYSFALARRKGGGGKESTGGTKIRGKKERVEDKQLRGMAEELRKWHGILEAKVGRFVGIETGIGDYSWEYCSE